MKKIGTPSCVIKLKEMQACCSSARAQLIHFFFFAMAAEAVLVEAGDAQMQVRELNIQIKNKIF